MANSAYADSHKISKLEAQCEQAREAKLKPLRQKEIKSCIKKDKGQAGVKEKCERFYADYGAGAKFKTGGNRQRMFNDLPECVALNKAEVKRMHGTSR